MLRTYYEILDKGVSPIELYICDKVMSDGIAMVTSNMQVEKLVERIKQSYINDPMYREVEYHIQAILSGDYDDYGVE